MNGVQTATRRVLAIAIDGKQCAKLSASLPQLLGRADELLIPLPHQFKPKNYAIPPQVVVIFAKEGENPSTLAGRIKEMRQAFRNQAKIVTVPFAKTKAEGCGADAVAENPTPEAIAAAVIGQLPKLATDGASEFN